MKETIVKRFFAPIWKCDEIEAELSRLEKEGWRLDKISGFRKFEFTKATPKDTTHFFTFSIKGYYMHDYEYFLKREYKALPIKGFLNDGLIDASVYRIPTCVNLNQWKHARNFRLRRLLLENIFVGLFLLSISIAGIVLCFLDTAPFPIAEFIFLIPFALMGAGIFFPNLFGWIYLRKQYKKFRKSGQE